MTTAEKIVTPQNVLDVFRKHEHFARVLLDAFVVVDRHGQVVKSNQLFSQLVGQSSKQVLKAESFDQLLTFSIENQQISIHDLLKYTIPTRLDEIRGKNNVFTELNLIIGVYPFFSDFNPTELLGALILIRDVTAETNLQDKYKHTAIKSITDPLTGLFTRGYFEDYLDLQIKAMNAMGQVNAQEIPKLSLIMIDIDYFKKVNDQHGHQAGDHILKAVAATMKREFRKTDVACRYGGEEFLVILPGAGLKDAGTAANKVRKAIESQVITFEGKTIPVTVSCGVGCLDFPREGYMETIARADNALYQSKKNGRNQVNLHDGNAVVAHDPQILATDPNKKPS